MIVFLVISLCDVQVNEDEDRRRLKEKLKEATDIAQRNSLISEESEHEVSGREWRNSIYAPYKHHRPWAPRRIPTPNHPASALFQWLRVAQGDLVMPSFITLEFCISIYVSVSPCTF